MFDLSAGHSGFLLPELYDSPSFTYLNTSSSVQSFHSLCKKPSLPIEVMVRAVYLYRMEGVVNDQGIPSPFAELADVWSMNKSHPAYGWTLLAKDIWSVEDLNSLKWRKANV